jgi:hypothetical protein
MRSCCRNKSRSTNYCSCLEFCLCRYEFILCKLIEYGVKYSFLNILWGGAVSLSFLILSVDWMKLLFIILTTINFVMSACPFFTFEASKVTSATCSFRYLP